MTKDYTNFREANDSPGKLLSAKSAELYEKATRLNFENPAASETARKRAAEYGTAGIFLFSHEVQNGVTFVALDNADLNWLLETVADFREEKDPYDKAYLAEAAVRRVIDLLGLED